jgi:hypothetical protein
MTVDEVNRHFRDKALAIEAYAKQANDYDLEHDAAAARVRAERKCGELLRDMEKAKGAADGTAGPGRGNVVAACDRVLDRPKTLSEMGITKDQSSKWQKLAAVPEDEFEEAVNSRQSKPSANNILKPKQEPPPERMDADVLWWWGRLCDMEKGRFAQPLSSVLADMTDAMRSDALRVIPQLKKWVNDYE